MGSIFSYSLFGLGMLCCVTILYFGFSRGIARRFPIFFSFVGIIVLRDSLGIYLINVLSPNRYGDFYYVSSFVTTLVQVLLLIEIYWVVKLHRNKGHWVVLGVFTLLMLVYCMRQPEPYLYLIAGSVLFYFQVLFCILLNVQLFKNREVDLGGNYTSILIGLSILAAIQSCNYGLRHFHYIDPVLFTAILQTACLIPWVVWVFGMSRLSPPRPVDPAVVREIELLEQNLSAVARSVR